MLLGLAEQKVHYETALRTEPAIEPARVYQAIGKRAGADFRHIRALNEEIARFRYPDWRLFKRQQGYLETSHIPDIVSADAEVLKRLQAAADVAAQIYQGRLMGRMEALGFGLRQDALLSTLASDVIKSSEIEGEKLDPDQVRSSIARTKPGSPPR